MAEQPAASPAFGLFNRDLLPERIVERLLSLIAERQLRPGDRLPSERDLAAAMQVSRATLREALRASNLDAATDACPAGSVSDVITLPSGTYPFSGQ